MGDQHDSSIARHGANAGGMINNTSKNMLGSNNDYFFNDQQNKEGGENDDDFWYGQPKGGAFDNPGMEGGDFNSYGRSAKPDASGVKNKPPSGKRSGNKFRR